MQLEIKVSTLKVLREKYPNNLAFEEPEQRWCEVKVVESRFISVPELALLRQLVEEAEASEKNVENRRLIRKLNALRQLHDGKDKIKNLEAMTEAMIAEIGKLPLHWVFSEDTLTGELLPYFVRGVKFIPAEPRNETPAHIKIDGQAVKRGEMVTLSRAVYRTTLGEHGISAPELLGTLGLILETPDLMGSYVQSRDKQKSLTNKIGLQVVGNGKATSINENSRWSRDIENLTLGGKGTKLVIDDRADLEAQGSKGGKSLVACSLWSKQEGEDDKPHSLPIHPYVRAFNLKTHGFVQVHVNNLEEYKYEEGLQNSLVLSNAKKELVDMLVSSGGDDSRDIVQGKSGGVIIITSGPPGTGKTLTAEVFAEKVKKPLYVVQCSQLGVDSDSLEKRLQEVLTRAARWGAVLLIDEADVYIHERGSNIHQNAIVGVFLRVLEYYSGVLFLTTNRETTIDDAIMSRAIAHVRYSKPSRDERISLWTIMTSQYGVLLADLQKEQLADAFPEISGRTVKQLVRLAKALANSRGVTVDVELIKEIAVYQNID